MEEVMDIEYKMLEGLDFFGLEEFRVEEFNFEDNGFRIDEEEIRGRELLDFVAIRALITELRIVFAIEYFCKGESERHFA